MGMISRSIAAAILMLILIDGVSYSATKPFEKVTTSVSNATTFPRGVRNIGMGGVGAADISGFSSGYFNPASFAWSDAITLGASTNDFMSYQEFFDARLSAGYLFKDALRGSDLRLGGSLAYSTRTLNLGTERTIYIPSGTQLIEGDNPDRCLSGSIAACVRRGIGELALGGTVKYLDAGTIGEYKVWAYDLGIIAAADVGRADGLRVRPRIGASVRNLGKDIEMTYGDAGTEAIVFDQPGEHRYGIGVDAFSPPVDSVTRKLRRGVSVIGVSMDYDIVQGDGTNLADGWAFGAEISLFEMLRLRAGRSDDVFLGMDCTTYGIGLGWDFGRVLAQFDYARMVPACDACGFLGIDPEEDAFGLVLGGRF